MTNSKKILIALIVLMLVVVVGVWYVRYKIDRRSVEVFSDVSSQMYATLLNQYEKDGLSNDEVRTLVGYLARTVAMGVYPDMQIRSVVVGDINTGGKTFSALNIKVVLDRAYIDIDNITYDGVQTAISFSVPRDGKGGFLGHVSAGKVYILYLKDGKWILGR
jgi:hypothetical protein